MSFGSYGGRQTSIRGPKLSPGRSRGGVSSSLPSSSQKCKKTLFLLLSEQRGPALRRSNFYLFSSCFWSQNGNAGSSPENKYKLKSPPRRASTGSLTEQLISDDDCWDQQKHVKKNSSWLGHRWPPPSFWFSSSSPPCVAVWLTSIFPPFQFSDCPGTE